MASGELELIDEVLQNYEATRKQADEDLQDRVRTVHSTGHDPCYGGETKGDNGGNGGETKGDNGGDGDGGGDGGGGDGDGNGGETKGTPCPDIPVSAERRGQKYAAIAIVHHDGHTLVCPFGARENLDECRTYADDIARRHPMYDIYCVDLYTWIFPHLVETETFFNTVPKTFHDPTYGRIVEEHMQAKKKCASYKDARTAMAPWTHARPWRRH